MSKKMSAQVSTFDVESKQKPATTNTSSIFFQFGNSPLPTVEEESAKDTKSKKKDNEFGNA